MYAENEVTVEKAQAYKAALEHELEGLERRIANLKAGKQDPVDAKTLDGRVAAVKAEIKRVRAQIKAVEKESDEDEPADVPDAEEEEAA